MTDQQNTPELEVDHLNIWMSGRKGEVPIIQDVSFTLHRGEKIGIAGESGAGKSVTMKAVSALLPLRSTRVTGRILFRENDGSVTDLLQIPLQQRNACSASKVSIIFQDSMNALNPFERVVQQWGDTVRLHHPEITEEKMLEYLTGRLKIFGIEGGADVLRRYPHQLSGGMKQRIAIGMALESEAKILICDEPTTALDAISQRKTVRFIEQICRENELSMLYISHNLGILKEICSRMIVMKDGQIVENGETGRVFRSPEDPYTRKLIHETMQIFVVDQWVGKQKGEKDA